MDAIQTTEQLHRCIVLANTTSSNNNDSSKSSSLLDIMCSAHDGGSRLCTNLLREMFQRISFTLYPVNSENQQVINVLFYCLSTIQRTLTKDISKDGSKLAVKDSIRMELRYIIFHYILCIPTNGSNGGGQMHGSLLPKFLRTKVGVVLSLLIQADFPDRWVNAFQDLIQTLNFASFQEGNGKHLESLPNEVILEIQRKDIFLRFLDAFCDEVVEQPLIDKNSLIKDLVRGFSGGENGERTTAPETSISASILEAIFRIFQWSYPFINNKQPSSNLGFPELQRLPIKSMAVLKRFIPWVELSLILNENIISLLFTCLAAAGPGDADDDDGSFSSQVAVQVLECLKEIVEKGMENQKKVSLIVTMRFLERMDACGLNLVEIDGTHINVVIKVAELINSIGLELLTFWDNHFLNGSLPSDVNEMLSIAAELSKLLNIFFYVFAYDDIDVSGAVIPLAIRLITTVGKEFDSASKELRFNAASHLSQLMTVMYKQMQYPLDFQFDYEDEDDAEEEIYRCELRKLNQAVTRICPEESLQFICKILSEIQLPLSTAPTPVIEAALRLVYHYCEGIRPVPGINVAMKNETFRDILISLLSSDIMTHKHREVLLLYYDISVRYAMILKDRTDLLPSLLNSLTSGLQHEHCRVRSRSCYFLLKLVKSLGTLIRPFVEPAIRGIVSLLSSGSSLTLNPDDSLYLFETVGLLLGKSGLDKENQRIYLTEVITPYIQRIESVLNDPNLHRDPDYYGGILAYDLAGLAFLSKGFTTKICPEVQQVLTETLPIAIKVVRSIPNFKPVRDKCMIYLQRMILCLGDLVLSYLQSFLELLIQHCTSEDILDVAQLLNQTCFKFRDQAINIIDKCMLPFLEKCQVCISNLLLNVGDKDPPPHLLTEKLMVLKILYAFLHQIVSTQCTEVLLSSRNFASLEDILRTMGEGATSIPDPVMKKTCVQFFRELIRQWLSGDCKETEILRIQNGFKQYILSNFLPGMLICFTRTDFDVNDAMQYRVVREVAVIMSDVKSACNEAEFKEFLVGYNASNGLASSFYQAETASAMEKCLKGLIKSMKT